MVEEIGTSSVVIQFPHTLSQQQAKQFVSQAILQNRFPHATIVYGAKGVGQTSFLLDTAAALLCESKEKIPCGKCRECRARKHGTRESLLFLFPSQGKWTLESEMETTVQKKSLLYESPYRFFCGEKETIGIESIRNLIQKLSYKEDVGTKRIILLFWPERLTQAAANALLKTLEEPPPNCLFLLASESRNQVLPTILSRCIQIGMAPLETDEMGQAQGRLQKWAGETYLAELLPLCEGSIGVFLQWCSQISQIGLETLERFVLQFLQRDLSQFLEFLRSVPDLEDAEHCLMVHQMMLELLMHHLRSHHQAGEESGLLAETSEMAECVANPDRAKAFQSAVEGAIRALKQYCRPQSASVGAFLSYHHSIERWAPA